MPDQQLKHDEVIVDVHDQTTGCLPLTAGRSGDGLEMWRTSDCLRNLVGAGTSLDHDEREVTHSCKERITLCLQRRKLLSSQRHF